ncbi:13816_t:CDS:2 [Entrophospora sp. SA101]|nr:13816_t:CDS:2 [Entrophospora sp. SA101]
MSDNIENYFYRNRHQPNQDLYFKEWLPSVYLPSIEVLRKANFNIAETQYCREFEEGIKLCNRNSSRNKRKLKDIFLFQFDAISKNAGTVSIEGCSQGICRPVWVYLILDLETIELEILIVSRVIDLTRNEDLFTKLLSFGTKQILSKHSFRNNEFPNQIGAMLDEFVSSYRKLRTDFDPALIRPIIFPQGEMILETRRILMTTFDLLEGLRHIWSCRSLLTEDDYSENAYVIHAVSKEKNQDLQILLKLDMKENELVLVEISRSFPEQDKEGLDSKKLDKSYKKKGTENIAKVIVNGIQNNILSDELEIQSFSFSNNVTKILATDTSSNSSTTPLLELTQLFVKTTDAEYYAIKANQGETLCWINYGKEFIIQYNDLVKNSNGKIDEKKAKEKAQENGNTTPRNFT